MTPQQIEALKLALEALEGFYEYGYDRQECFEHITAIKEALLEHAMQEVQRLGQEIEQEPCVHAKTPKGCYRVRCQLGDKCVDDEMSFRTSPPQRKPLTDEQYFEIGQRHWLSSSKVEQIHKELEEAAHGIKGEA